MTTNSTERVIYTVKEISLLLHCSIGYAYRLIETGLLPALKLGSLRVRKESLNDFLKKYEGYDLSDLTNVKVLNLAS